MKISIVPTLYNDPTPNAITGDDVVAAAVLLDEAEALLSVEPLHSADGHGCVALSAVHPAATARRGSNNRAFEA